MIQQCHCYICHVDTKLVTVKCIFEAVEMPGSSDGR